MDRPGNSRITSNRKQIIDILFVLAVFTVMTVYYMNYFAEESHTDMYAHSIWAHNLKVYYNNLLAGNTDGLPTGVAYPGWHILFYLFYRLFHSDALALGLTNALFLAATAALMLYAFEVLLPDRPAGIKKYLYTGAMMFTGPLYSTLINEKYYLGQLTPNLWHNPSTLAVKPFCVAAVIIICKILSRREENGRNNGLFIWLAVVMALSCLFKPSFAQFFVPALVIYCVCELIFTRGKYFFTCVRFAFSCIPTGLVLILQYLILYKGVMASASGNVTQAAMVASAGEKVVASAVHAAVAAGGQTVLGTGIGFSPFFVWKEYSPCIAGSILLSLAFPLLVYLLMYKELFKNPLMKFGLASIIAGVAPFALLYNEYGTYNGDFSWGASLSVLALFMLSCILLEEYRIKTGKKAYWWAIGLLSIHVLCGFIYWVNMYFYLDLAIPLFPFL